MDLKSKIRDIPDYPKPGITFRDITPLLADPKAFSYALYEIDKYFRDVEIDKVMGLEARGFIFGAALAFRFGVGFVPARKPGKLPGSTISEPYELEYGTSTLEIQRDALKQGEQVLIVDDLIATGGTVGAATRLVERAGAHVAGIAVVIELSGLHDEKMFDQYNVYSLIQYGEFVQ